MLLERGLAGCESGIKAYALRALIIGLLVLKVCLRRVTYHSGPAFGPLPDPFGVSKQVAAISLVIT